MPGLLLSLFLAPATLILALPPSRVPTSRPVPAKKVESGVNSTTPFPRKPFLTAYRGGMLVVTSIAILAVDFKVFPRRFAKVETWGTSLMDVGVGSFVFAAGIASSKPFLKNSIQPLDKQSNTRQTSFIRQLFNAIRQSLPLLILGVARLISVKNLEYAEHVSEYGVHWNFFFTLAILPPALCFLQPILSALPGPAHGYIGLFLIIIYEIILQTTGLKAWALTAPREGLLTQNKEGIVSSVGYLAIFLFGMETGGFVLPRYIPQGGLLFKMLRILKVNVGSESPRVLLIASLASCAAFYSLLLVPFYSPRVFPWLSIPISRRLANAPYVLWIGAYNTAQLLLFALVESFVFPTVHRAPNPTLEQQVIETATPQILEDYNASGLLVFLLANLGTGLVNLSINTLAVNSLQAVAILTIYMALLTTSAHLLKGVKIKL
jgi:glucosaminylphosphatidylinositol acyltransferase